MNGFITVGSKAVGVLGCAVEGCSADGHGLDLRPVRLHEGTGWNGQPIQVRTVLCTAHRVELDPDGSLIDIVTVPELRKAPTR